MSHIIFCIFFCFKLFYENKIFFLRAPLQGVLTKIKNTFFKKRCTRMFVRPERFNFFLPKTRLKNIVALNLNKN